MAKFKIGLVLGGGGARGLAHIGVIKALRSAGIHIDVITGASMGALIGGIYAQKPDPEYLERRVANFIKGPKFRRLGVNNFPEKSRRDPDDIISQMSHRVQRRIVINLAANRISLLKAQRLNIAVTELLADKDIAECQLPFACTAADLNSGKEIIFTNGPIQKAIQGSAAIPGFIPPVKYDGYLLIDGSTVNNFPIDTARKLGANFVVSVDVSLDYEPDSKVSNVIDLVMRSAQITRRKLNELSAGYSDFVVKPEIGNVHWSEFSRVDELIRKGEDAIEHILPSLKKRLRGAKFPLVRYISKN